LAAGCWAAWGRDAGVAAFAAGTLLDVDHFIDYRWNGHRDFDPGRFVRLCREYRLPRFYLFLHSLEWIVPFSVWALFFSGVPWLRASALGLILHMALDLTGNGLRPLAYVLVWRMRRSFESRRLVSKLPSEAMDYWGTQAAFMRGKPDRRALGARRLLDGRRRSGPRPALDARRTVLDGRERKHHDGRRK
jgi:hypothetical protein